jgi:hypothetical protein
MQTGAVQQSPEGFVSLRRACWPADSDGLLNESVVHFGLSNQSAQIIT